MVYTAVNLNMFDLEMGGATASVSSTIFAALFMVSFQFFSGELVFYRIYEDMRGTMSNRLFMTPITVRTFIGGVAAASWVFNIVQAALIFAIPALIFGANWGNPLVFIGVLLMISVISQLIGALISLVVPKFGVAKGIHAGLCFLMMGLSGGLPIPIGTNDVMIFIMQYGTPLGLGFQAIINSGYVMDDMPQAMLNMGILACIMVVLAVIVAILAKRRQTP